MFSRDDHLVLDSQLTFSSLGKTISSVLGMLVVLHFRMDVYMCMVFPHVGVHVCTDICAHVCTCTWRPEVGQESFLIVSTLFFETELFR